jgi:hypothetical protein
VVLGIFIFIPPPHPCFLVQQIKKGGLFISIFRQSGLLVGQFDRTSFFEELPESQHKVHMFPLEGKFYLLTCFQYRNNEFDGFALCCGSCAM